MVHLGARKQGEWLDACWGMGSEARKMVADRVKAKGGALRDRKTCLTLRLDKGRQHGVYVSMSTYVCAYFVVCNNWMDAASSYGAASIQLLHTQGVVQNG